MKEKLLGKECVIVLLIFLAQIVSEPVQGQIVQKQKITPSDRTATDRFGHAVSISGSYAIVGGYQGDKDAAGTNALADAGSAYIFERNTFGVWVQKQKLVASDRATLDFFGYSVAVSGSYAVVSAIHDDEDVAGMNTLNNSGSIYIFERNISGNWIQVQKLTATDRGVNDEFGYSVSISGNRIIVGSYLEDEDTTGSNTLLNAGSAYIYERNMSGMWQQIQKIVAVDRASTDGFGVSVSIVNDKCMVGAYQEDEDANGLNTRTDAGSAYLFARNGSGQWLQVKKVVANDRAINDRFGISVSINDSVASVGAFNQDKNVAGTDTLADAGAVYIYNLNNAGNWLFQQKIVAPDRAPLDWFGYSISMSSGNLIVGAYQEDEDANGLNTRADAGSAYLYKWSGTSWLFIQKIITTDRAIGDNMGEAVSVSGNLYITGAYSEDENATETNTLNNAGSAYFFGCPIWYQDNDKDGFGSQLVWIDSCFVPTTYLANNADCNDNDFSINSGLQEVCGNSKDDNCNGNIDETTCSVSLKVKLYFQGFYNSMGLTATANRISYPTICDTITVCLAAVSTPHQLLYTATGILNINGEAVVNFALTAANNPYYIVIRHRSSIETWSKQQVTLGSETFYDFAH